MGRTWNSSVPPSPSAVRYTEVQAYPLRETIISYAREHAGCQTIRKPVTVRCWDQNAWIHDSVSFPLAQRVPVSPSNASRAVNEPVVSPCSLDSLLPSMTRDRFVAPAVAALVRLGPGAALDRRG